MKIDKSRFLSRPVKSTWVKIDFGGYAFTRSCDTQQDCREPYFGGLLVAESLTSIEDGFEHQNK